MVFLWFSYGFPIFPQSPRSHRPRRCLAPGRWALRTEPRRGVEGSGAVQGTSGKCRGLRGRWGKAVLGYWYTYIYINTYIYIQYILYDYYIYIYMIYIYIWSQKSSWWLNITFWTQLFDVPKWPFKWLFLWVHLLIPGILPQALLKEAFDASAESMSGAETFLLGFLGFTLFSCFRRGYFALRRVWKWSHVIDFTEVRNCAPFH